jgi:hypothetical protein
MVAFWQEGHRAKLSHSNGYSKLKNRALFWTYIVIVTVKKRIIIRTPWQERKDTEEVEWLKMTSQEIEFL